MSATGEHESSGNAALPTASFPVSARKPHFALFIATAGGLGYLPKAPGTFGSLAGLLLAMLPSLPIMIIIWTGLGVHIKYPRGIDPMLIVQIFFTLIAAGIGVWAADRAANFWREKDPQRVVIDEVSGQHLTLLLGCGIPVWWRTVKFPWDGSPVGLISFHSVLSWKYLLLGLILFRVFDIWKPFPARQAESLPGGWGIMTDDWVAGIYAAIGLWIARAAGL
jgi:phosphatidylglycerophosphatase A